MKTPIGLVSFIILAASCSQPPPAEKPGLDRFSWMLGSWEHQQADSVWQFETWERQSDTLFGGFGFTSMNDSILFSEILSLELVNDTVYYTARVKGQNHDQAIRFRVTESDTLGFTSVNPAHDYPQKISYLHAGLYPYDSLVAVISGPGRDHTTHDRTFSFKRKKPESPF